MPIAAIYDIHGNLPALEAVLNDIAQEGVDVLVVGGDVVSGPMPRAVLARLLGLTTPVKFIQGNADREVLTCMDGNEPTPDMPEFVRELTRWVAEQLGSDRSLGAPPSEAEALEVFERMSASLGVPSG